MVDQDTPGGGTHGARLLPDRPLTGPEMLGATLALLRRQPAATLGLGALLSTVSAVVNGVIIDGILIGSAPEGPIARLLTGAGLTGAELSELSAAIAAARGPLLILAAVGLVVQIAASGTLTIVTNGAINGTPVPPANTWARVPWPRLIVTNVLIGIAMAVGALVAVPLSLMGGNSGAIVGLGVGLAWALAAAVATALAVPAAVLENGGPWQALRHGFALVRGAFWRTAWLLLLANAFGQAVATLVSYPITVLTGIGGGTAAQTFSGIAGAIAGGAVSLPIVTGMTTIVYHDRLHRIAAQERQ